MIEPQVDVAPDRGEPPVWVPLVLNLIWDRGLACRLDRLWGDGR